MRKLISLDAFVTLPMTFTSLTVAFINNHSCYNLINAAHHTSDK